MKKVFLFLLFYSLGWCVPVLAYEEAIIGAPTRREWTDMWCGYQVEKDHYVRQHRGPECVIEIRGDYLVVNRSGKIHRDQVVHLWGGGPGFLVTFNEGEEIRTIAFGTEHGSRSASLWVMLNLWLYAGQQ
ncbi:hypothetical protein [Synechococcus sp. RS9907]|uniref:hypothetical protein n=1 Tax=Synechococcus sp. RS9907 TaxID=221350 RepID=UPI001CB757C3|nr:hypothetical protein [Synechococcus sp. RS9907]